jgi:hypothetical protein
MFHIPPGEFTPGERVVLHFVGWDVDDHGRRVYMTQRRLVKHSGFQPEKITQTLVKAERKGRLELKRSRGGRIVDWRVLPIARLDDDDRPARRFPQAISGKAADSPADSLSTIDDRRSSDRGLVDPTIDVSAPTLSFDEGLADPPSFDPSLDPSRTEEAALRAAVPPESSKPQTPNPEDETERRAFLERARRVVFGGGNES